ncbi:MAG: sigma-70 family RNA polymerase sigma factor [Planctomycetes bacterium]|nr:sigma-70 family RNA polymerase sigma factor [Planctomycetota bacterium]MCB9884168.1 sigma-70 family RNA polymerase sigma factor [Planctomycetota bacterium]
MSDPHDLDHELQRHAVALRSIARDLVRDAHAAEDVTQQAFYQAAARKDLAPGPLGGWLYRTVVNFARQWRRQQSRQTRRLAALPEPPPTRSSADLLSRAETLQAVTQAVLALDEPYQTAILMRYFEDLPPREIAARTDCSVATVKSRLARGLAQLRARLDRQCHGDSDRWRLAMASTFGLPTAAAAAGITITTGLWIMGTTTKTLAAAGLLFAGGLLVYTFGKDPAPPADPTKGIEAGDQTRAATGATEAKTNTAIREAAADASDTATDWLDHPYLLELSVRVVDPTGLPVSGRTLRLGPPGCTLDDMGKDTGADGVTLLQWPSRLPTGEVILADPIGLMHRITLQHGVPRSITVGTRGGRRSGTTFEFRISGNNGMVLSGVPIVANLFHEEADVPTARGMHPYAVFASAAAQAVRRQNEVTLFDAVEGVSYEMSVHGKNKAAADEPPTVGIAGTVYGEDGAIAKGVAVALLGSTPQPVQRTTTDENGQFRFDKLKPGEFTVRAGGDAEGLGTSPAITTTGVTPVTVNLRRETFVKGRAQTADGKPIGKARIVWFAEDGSWWDMTEAGDDGAFVLANLPDARGTVLLLPPGNDRSLPLAAVQNVLTNTGDLVLQHDPDGDSQLRFDLVPPDGTDTGSIGARLWNDALGIGVNMARPEPGKPWVADKLVAGWYRADLFVPGCGWIDLGRHWVDHTTTCDLGMITPPAPCLVEVRCPASPAQSMPAPATNLSADEPPTPPTEIEFWAATKANDLELYAIRGDVDLRLRVGKLTHDCDLRLPAGDYALARRDAAGAVHFHRFSTRRGETTRVELPE